MEILRCYREIIKMMNNKELYYYVKNDLNNLKCSITDGQLSNTCPNICL